MKQATIKVIDTSIFYTLLIITILGSILILKQKKSINQLKSYKAQVETIDEWHYSNFVLSNLWNGEEVDYVLIGSSEICDTAQASVFLVFSNDYCESCLRTELSRIKKANNLNKIGVLALPKAQRELKILKQSDLKEVSCLATLDKYPDFWTPDMDELITYIKIKDNKVCDLIIVNEALPNPLDQWIVTHK